MCLATRRQDVVYQLRCSVMPSDTRTKLTRYLDQAVSLFDDSGFAQPEVVIWTSPVLPYGNHTVTLAQIGIDSRLG